MSAEEEFALDTKNVAIYVGCTVALIIIAFILFLVFARQDPTRAGEFQSGDNCAVVTCPSTIISIPQLVVGPIGPPGPTGAQGEQGPQGLQGPAGIAMCIANPACGVGPPGPSGPSGATGAPGAPGFKGDKGDAGAAGPQGETGATGPSGPSGPQGLQGIQGIPGVCDCFNTTQTFNGLIINSTLHLNANSTITCDAGALIDPSCLLVGACPDFSPCNLMAHGLNILGGTGISPNILKVGGGGATAYVEIGDPLTYAVSFITYATTYFLQGTSVIIESYAGPPYSNPYIRLLTSTMELFSPTQITMMTSGIFSTGIQMQAETGGIRLLNQFDTLQPILTRSLSSIIEQSDRITWNTYANGTWMATQSTSYYYNMPAGTVFVGQTSIQTFVDFVVNETKSVVSTGNYLQVGPNLDVGEGAVQTSAQFLKLGQVGGFFANVTQISMEAVVQNALGVPFEYKFLPNGYMWFGDQQGYHFSLGNMLIDGNITQIGNTIFDNTTSHRLDIQTIIINTNDTVPAAVANLTAGHIVINDDVLITGNLQVDGQISATLCTGCVSDRRTKHRIEMLSKKSSYHRLRRLKPISFEYTPLHKQKNKLAPHGKQHGFVAQEVEPYFPFATQKHAHLYGVDDMYSLHKDMLIPDLVNTVQYLAMRIKRLEKILSLKKH